MAKIMDPILLVLSILGYWVILGSFGGPGIALKPARSTKEKPTTLQNPKNHKQGLQLQSGLR